MPEAPPTIGADTRNVKMLPTVSIVTPSYNQAEFLERTMSSVLEQDYPNLEYVVIDAGSSDGSIDIIRKHAHRLAYWVSEPDRGHADGINKGFSKTSGEIMGWINSSDVYFPWTLGTVAQVFTDVPEAQWIMGVPTHLAEGTAPQDVAQTYWNVYDILSGNYAWIQQESVFWRRGLWEAAGGRLDTSMQFACDFELWLRFFRCAPLYHVNTILAGFRFHGDRRGDRARDSYSSEAAHRFTRFTSQFGGVDRWRATLVRFTNNPVGRLVRESLKRANVWGWYHHPRIVHDFGAHYWKIA